MIDALVGEISDYSKMLRKLSVWAFLLVSTVTGILALYLPSVKAFTQFFPVNVFGFSLPVLTVVPGLLAAILSQLPLHDRVSDLLQIRHKFDLRYILIPLAEGVGIEPSTGFVDGLAQNRRKVMRQVFYRYTSGRECCVDQHLVNMVLTSWSWYWLGLESALYLLVAAAIAAFGGEYALGSAFVISSGVAGLFMYSAYMRSRDYATREVEDILAAAERKTDIRVTFNALQGQGQTNPK